MATYVITGRSPGGDPLVSVQVAAINQEQRVVDDIDVVNAVRGFLAGLPEIGSVVAQKYEQVITVI
jgi:hypothetical protein